MILGACSGNEGRPEAAAGNDLTNADAATAPFPDAGLTARTTTPPRQPSEHDGGTTAFSSGSTCGNDFVDSPTEQCDGQSAECIDLGFDTGRARCSSNCLWELERCEGTENCTDGRDNDGDGLVDCLDTLDCGASCSDPCFQVPTLASLDSVLGSTTNHAHSEASSCAEGHSPSVVYRLTADATGKLDILLNSAVALSLGVTRNCGSPLTELSCNLAGRQTLDVEAGQELYLTVSGATPLDFGTYSLQTAFRQLACGDGIRDEEEACDDGNIKDGDGCDPDCNLERLDPEPFNNSWMGASWYQFSERTVAEIRPTNDVDYYRVVLTEQSSTLVVETLNLGDGACALNLMDTVIDIFDTPQNGDQLIVSDDNSGDGLCARATASGLSPGTYTLRVMGTAFASPGTFPYNLSVTAEPCGDGNWGPGEQCDDGNFSSGDGCSSSCRVEN